MGITQISLDRINKYLQPNSKIFIVGCQNLYNMENYGEIAANYFKMAGHVVKDIDIYECNGCQIADLRDDWRAEPYFDMVFQHGTIEHIDGGLYQPLKNLHESCLIGGLMIHENPLTNNWPLHGKHYFTKDFWTAFADRCNYEVHELTEEASMGNYVDGWNVSCVLKKTADSVWLSEKEFDKIYKLYIKSK